MAREVSVPGEGRAGLTAGSVAGFFIGMLSGFAGVGGGEYRSPVLLVLLRNVRLAIATNLAIGVAVSVTSFGLRGGYSFSTDYLLLALALVATSLPGAYLGTLLTRRVSSRGLKLLLASILLVTGLRFILFETGNGTGFALTPQAVVLALLFGFGLGMISGLLGLAAGEYRIPALVLVFGLSARLAGTVSSLAAIPQQALAYWEHRRLGHTAATANRLGLAMALASIAGVALGILVLGRTSDVLVTKVLGVAMIGAAVRVAWEVRRVDVPVEAPPRPSALDEAAG